MANYNGTNGDDVFAGTPDGDSAIGNGGNDQLSGAGGDDYLEGDDGDDALDGGDGADTLDGGPGSDQLTGGAGDDFIFGGTGNDQLTGGSGDDVLRGDDGNDSLVGGDGNDLMRGGAGVDSFNGGSDRGGELSFVSAYGDTVSFLESKATQGVVADLRIDQIYNDGFGNAEIMSGIESFGGGTAFADEFYGNDGINHLEAALGDTTLGFGGDDYIIVRAAPALVDGGAGIDRMVLALSGSLVPGSNGSSVAVQAPTMSQGYQVDLAAGTLVDGNGHSGSVAGIEQVVGTSLGDALLGSSGDDWFSPGAGSDTIDGRGGIDTVSYAGDPYDYWNSYKGGMFIDLAAGQAVETFADHQTTGSSPFIYGVPPGGTTGSGATAQSTDTLAGIENVAGTGLGDTIYGDAADNRIAPGAGNDIVDGRGGIDTIDYSSARAAVSVNLATGVANEQGTGETEFTTDGGFFGTILRADDYSASTDQLANIENAVGSGFADTLVGGSGANRLEGGGGDDVLTGGAGADTLDGGAGTDTVDYSAESGSGGVTVNLRTTEIYGASIAFGPQRGLDTYGSYDSVLNIENVKTGGGNDSVYGDGGANRIETGAGADYLNGGGGDDQLYGGAGFDTLSPTGLGHSIADGGADSDTLFLDWSGATAAIVLNAPSGTASGGYSGSIADDGARSVDFTGIETFYITTGSGNDVIRTGGNGDTVHLGAGADQATGGGGSDQLFGEAGDDVLSFSGLGHVFANGGADYDRLVIDWSDATSSVASTTPSGTVMNGYSGSIGDGGARSADFFGIESFDITTGSANDVVRTGGGDDIVHLGAGNDIVYLGSGDPGSSIGSGNDVADGGADVDGISVDLSAAAASVVWNLATNSYSGPLGAFTNFEYFVSLTSGSGNDRITTSTLALDDAVMGGAGADIITVYAGHDGVNGGLDNDLLVIDYSAATDAVTTSNIQTGSGGGSGWQGIVSDGGSRGVFFDNIERLDLTTGSGNDFVSGAGGADTIRTGLGADTLSGGDGNDILNGGAGADQMAGGTGNDIYLVDDSGDVVTENAGEGTADEVQTALSGYVLPANVEKLTWTGAGGGDLRGNAGDNVLTGGGGNDFVRAQDGGNDNVSLGAGNDAVYFGASYTSADVVDGGSGSDQVGLQGYYANGVILGTLTGVETLVAMSGSDTRFGADGNSPSSYLIIAPDSTVAAGTQLMINASTLLPGENLTFDGHAETDGSFFIYGGKGIDFLTGGSGADVFFFAEDGRFTANDRVDGGAGQDVMVLRGNYSMVLSGTSIVNVETVVLNSGSDARFYAAGTAFSYDITTADNTVTAGQTMTFNGGQLSSAETLHFNGSAETDGNFRLFGGSANDVIKGGAGSDLIYGGLGADQLTGGAGADVFWLKSAAESSSTHFDTINDFTYGTDHIDLPFAVSGFADHQAVGQVDFATFDADIARLVDGDLNPFGAIELTTHGGDVGDRFFLVVDADGDGAYHANLDYVIELPNVVVPPAPDIFV
jgi:Ca2+-binding RTX toxin-like protein